MSVRSLAAAGIGLLASVALAELPPLPPPESAPAAKADLRGLPQHGADTRCDKCHATEGWSDVSFAHQRTGFPLRGQHARTSCKGCHPASFTAPVPRSC
jgi:hypothetical protein